MRRLITHISALPPGSALTRSRRDDSWSQEAHILADVFDAVQRNTTWTIRAAGGTAGDTSPYPRPGDASAEPPMGSLADLHDFLRE